MRIAEVNIGEILKAQVSERLKDARASRRRSSAKNIGYELRCADPIPFDMEYTRDLGYCAAKYLLAGGNAAMISMQGGHFVPIPFCDDDRPRDRAARACAWSTSHSTRYAIARRYMIRLRRDDFEDPHELAKLAATRAPDARRNSGASSSIWWLHEPPPLMMDEHGERAGTATALTAARAPRKARRGRTMRGCAALSLAPSRPRGVAQCRRRRPRRSSRPARTVYVTRDRQSRWPVPDLGPADFVVKIGGKEREVVHVGAGDGAAQDRADRRRQRHRHFSLRRRQVHRASAGARRVRDQQGERADPEARGLHHRRA